MKIYLVQSFKEHEAPTNLEAFDIWEVANKFIQRKDKELNSDFADRYEKANKRCWRNYESFVRESKVYFDIEEIELNLMGESMSGGT